MKTYKGLLIAMVMLFLGTGLSYGQDSTGVDECKKWRGLYFQYLKQKMYRDAGTMWSKAVTACGEENLDAKFFTNGRVIYSNLIKSNKENPEIAKEQLDTMYWIYESRMKLEKDPKWELDFAVLLMSKKDKRYGKLDSLFTNVHTLKEKTKSSAIKQYFIHLILNKFNAADQETKEVIRTDIIEEYIHLSGYCSTALKTYKEKADEKNIKRYEGAQQFLDKYFLKIASDCAVLTGVLDKKLADLPEDKEERKVKVEEFLGLMDQKKCSKSETYGKYVDELISIEPTAGAYYFGARNQEENGNMKKATEYYKKAVDAEGEGENKNKYQFAYTNALYKTGSYKSAFSNAKLVQGDDRAKAMEICAGCIVKLANSCGESTFERKANYWLANDYIQKAGGSSSKYLDSAPSSEEVFNEGKTTGTKITLSCWGESTTIR